MLTAFYYDFKNIQIRTTVPGGVVLLNAAKAHSKGADIDLAWRPTSRLTLQGALSYLDSKYDDFPNPPYFRPAVNGAGVPTGGLVPFSGPNAAGNRTVNSPKWVTSLILDYAIPTALGEFGVVGAWEYNDGYYFDTQNLFASGSRHMVNATIRWTSLDKHFEINAYAKNLLGERYIISANTSSLGPLYWASAPTTYGVRAKLHF